MSSVDPLSGLDLTNPTIPTPLTGVYGTTIDSVDTSTLSETELDKITAQQLREDKDLFIQILTMYFRRARSKLSLGLYEEAQQSLKWYFQYLHGAGFYWDDFNTQVWGIKRYSAIFWNALVIDHLEGVRAQQAFTSRELLVDLDHALKNQKISQSERLQSQQFIHHLQEERRLPSHTQKSIDPSFRTLMKVAKFFQSHHMTEAAQRVLLHAHIQQALNMQRLQHQMNRLFRPTSNPDTLFPLASHLFPFEKTGLPFTTAQPYLHDENAHHTRSHQTVGLNYYTHNIHRVDPIDKDPNPDQQRKKRQQQTQQKRNQSSQSHLEQRPTNPRRGHLETPPQSPDNSIKPHPPLQTDVFEHHTGDPPYAP